MTTLHFISKPVDSIEGVITVPGDKSISHRSIILGSIAKGKTIIHGFLHGDDCMTTLKAFQAMGVSIKSTKKHQVIVHGVGKYGLKKPEYNIDCGNSGTSLRLLTGLLAAQRFDSQLTGDESLLKRPVLRVSKPLTQMGADISTRDGKPPILIKGEKKLNGIHYVMPEASAQVKSCILLAGIYAEGETSIVETEKTRNHTELMLKSFSYPVRHSGKILTINSANECIATEIFVPGDISSAAFFLVAATIIPKSNVLIRHVGINPTRTGVIHILLEMGANITLLNQRQLGAELVADLHVQYAPLKGINITADRVPSAIDEFPILFIAAACAYGQTTLHGAHELRVKESDRIATMVAGLSTLGISVEALNDGVVIEGGTFQGGIVESRDDHRIAMSFAIAGAVACDAVLIKDCAHVATSFPFFIKTAKKLQLQIKEVVNYES